MERCGTALLECIVDCKEDGACLSNCIRVEIECIDGESDILIIKYNITVYLRLPLRVQLFRGMYWLR